MVANNQISSQNRVVGNDLLVASLLRFVFAVICVKWKDRKQGSRFRCWHWRGRWWGGGVGIIGTGTGRAGAIGVATSIAVTTTLTLAPGVAVEGRVKDMNNRKRSNTMERMAKPVVPPTPASSSPSRVGNKSTKESQDETQWRNRD